MSPTSHTHEACALLHAEGATPAAALLHATATQIHAAVPDQILLSPHATWLGSLMKTADAQATLPAIPDATALLVALAPCEHSYQQLLQHWEHALEKPKKPPQDRNPHNPRHL